MAYSSNELNTRELIQKISTITNIPYDVIDTVLNAMMLELLKECSEQADQSTELIIRVPRMMDIYLSKDRYITVNAVYLTKKFQSMLRNSMKPDIDILSDKVIKSASKSIVDKYMKILDEDGDISG